MIDAHCHFDMMPNPEQYIQEAESKGDIIIGMTNLPSHFQMGVNHIKAFKHIRLALGLHPQLASEAMIELPLFDSLVDRTSYIGEIGLDFSRESIGSRDIQIECFRHVLAELRGEKRIISVHSRKAEKDIISMLKEFQIKNVVFHWYSGPINLINDILSEGYYFSINEAMTKSPHGKKIIEVIPKDRILTETDAPYNTTCSIDNTMRFLGMNTNRIKENFNRLLAGLE